MGHPRGASLNRGAVKSGLHAAIFTAPQPNERSLVMTSSQNEGQPSTKDFAELSEAKCQELLAQHTAGRISFMDGDGPLIFPVTSP